MVLCDVQFTEWLLPALWILHLNVFWFGLLREEILLERYLFYDRVWGLRPLDRLPAHIQSVKSVILHKSVIHREALCHNKDPSPHTRLISKRQEDKVLLSEFYQMFAMKCLRGASSIIQVTEDSELLKVPRSNVADLWIMQTGGQLCFSLATIPAE